MWNALSLEYVAANLFVDVSRVFGLMISGTSTHDSPLLANLARSADGVHMTRRGMSLTAANDLASALAPWWKGPLTSVT